MPPLDTSAAFSFVGISFFAHDTLLKLSVKHNVRVKEADCDRSSNEVHEKGDAENCLSSKPNTCNQNSNLVELQGSPKTQKARDDAKHEGGNEKSESFHARSIHRGGQADEAQSCETQRNYVHGHASSPGVTAAPAEDETKKNSRKVPDVERTMSYRRHVGRKAATAITAFSTQSLTYQQV